MNINEIKKKAAEISIKNDADMLTDCVNKMFVTKSDDELCTLYIRAGLCLDRIFKYHRDVIKKD